MLQNIGGGGILSVNLLGTRFIGYYLYNPSFSIPPSHGCVCVCVSLCVRVCVCVCVCACACVCV